MINIVVLGGRLDTNPEPMTLDDKIVTTFRLAIESLGATARRVDYVSIECSIRTANSCEDLLQDRYATCTAPGATTIGRVLSVAPLARLRDRSAHRRRMRLATFRRAWPAFSFSGS